MERKKNGKSGFHKILTEDFKEITGRTLEDEPELWIRFNDARLKRKTTLHPYVGKLSEIDAQQAIIDILNVINWVLEDERYPVPIINQIHKKHSFIVESVIKENGHLVGFTSWALYGAPPFRSVRFVQKYERLNSFKFGPEDLFLVLSPFKKEKIKIISTDRNEPVKIGELSQEAQMVFDKLPEYEPAPYDCPNDEWLAKHGKTS